MAINVVIPLLIPLEENLYNATRLLSGPEAGPLEFSEPRYCAVLSEDAQLAATVLTVSASHRHGHAVRYSMTGGNRDGLFTIDQHSGVITLAAALDYEIQDKHELVVAAEGGGEGHTMQAMVRVRVTDVNDNPPFFLNPKPQVFVVEEDDRHLPATIAKVEAQDPDRLDHHGLLYTVRGDGVDGYDPKDAFFAINSLTGELIQRRALDRDPPRGKEVWRVRIQVRDGQALWSRQAMDRHLASNSRAMDRHLASNSRTMDRHLASNSRTMDRHLARNSRTKDRHLASNSRTLDGHHRHRVNGGHIKSHDASDTEESSRENPMKELISRKGGNIYTDAEGKTSSDQARDINASSHLPGQIKKSSASVDKSHVQQNTVLEVKPSAKSVDSRLGILKHKRPTHSRREHWEYDEGKSRETRGVRYSPETRRAGKAIKGYTRHRKLKKLLSRHKGLNTTKLNNSDGRTPDNSVDEESRPIHDEGTSHTGKVGSILKSDNSKDYRVRPDLKLPSAKQRGNSSHSLPMSDITRLKRNRTYNVRSMSLDALVTSNVSPSASDNRSSISSRVQTTKKPQRVSDGTSRHSMDRRNTKESLSSNPEASFSMGKGLPESFPRSADPGKRLVRLIGWRTAAAVGAEEEQYEMGSSFSSSDGGCDDGEEEEEEELEEEMGSKKVAGGRRLVGGSLQGGSRVHVSETVLTLLVKDINDNPPVFPNATMFGHVQENGPIDLSVAVIAAWDADDASEGTNARMTYSIEKNVIQERTGEAIFSVHPDTGLVRTAICCLDRETSPEYQIQVVATDGGGLKGTGVVVVRLVDVNDNPPRLERRLWHVEMDETWGAGPPDDSTTLLHISVLDPDTANYFFYRVVEASGWGWEHFGMRTVGAEGQLYALKTLDFEDDTHRRGFKFMVQVTDRGRGGWDDPRHLDSAWVSVLLRDVNDNPPQFHRPHAHVTVREDAAPGTLLAALPARDPDMGETHQVEYRVEGGWGALGVDSEGGVSLRGALDREAPDGAIGVARILAVDGGQPPLTATASLTITVTDVNDSPPVLLPPTLFHVPEGGPPTLLGALTATDHDVWALGHGPPFNFSLAPDNPAHILAYINLKFDPHLDSGRGGAEVWTVEAVDREQHPQLLVGVWVADAGGLAATHALTLVIDDINDNPMKPAAKAVYLWKTQGGGSEAPLGRVYVDDPDDWDLGDKTFRWRGSPHPLFSLDANTGHIFASSQVTEGRYDLQFLVDDVVWGQRDVEANVTVGVRVLPPDALAHAAPITLTPTTPAQLTKGWTPEEGGGGLGRVVKGVLRVVGEAAHTVQVLSVYTHPHHTPHSPNPRFSIQPPTATPAPSACVWVSVREARGGFMDPVRLQGLLALHSQQLEEATNLTVAMEAPPLWPGDLGPHDHPALPTVQQGGAPDPSSAASRASTTLPLQLVDTNSTSLVTPRLTRSRDCHAHEPETCTPTSCLNGGRCIVSPAGNRCVCAGGSSGARCKVVSRTFSGGGWAWVRPLPPCLPTTMSLRILTRRPHALLLYSGPLAPLPPRPRSPPTPMLALQLWRGRPQLLLEGAAGPLKLQVDASLNDGDWHTIHLRLDPQEAALMVDLCGRGRDNTTLDDSHCAARASWTHRRGVEAWAASGPLQVGGLAHTPPSPAHHGWREAPTPRPLDGCVSHLRLNGQLVDLGEPAYSRGSEGGCRPQDAACPGGCGLRGRCGGGLIHPECECEPGWAGLGCTTPTVAATFGSSSYMKLTLSFRPGPQVVRAQLRLRTRGARHGLLLHLHPPQQHAPAFTVYLRGGVACASVSGAGRAARAACVEGRPVGDGAWHTVTAERHGHNLVISVDDGDAWRRNESLVSLGRPQEEEEVEEEGSPNLETPTPLDGDNTDGVVVGGWPEFVGVSLVNVFDDLADTCIDDLRVSGRPVPLPPAVNGTSWGQVTTLQGLEPGCSAPPDACLNTTCAPPLSCVSTWGRASCSCGPGGQLVGRTCEDVDECLWRPCLHGGSCYNMRPGFQCVCGPGHAGQHCQWTDPASRGHPLTVPLALAALTVSLLLLMVVGVVVSLRLRRHWHTRCLRGRQGGVAGPKDTIVEAKGGTDEGGGSGDAEHQAFLECMKLKLARVRSASPGKGEGVTTSQVSTYAASFPVTAKALGEAVASKAPGIQAGLQIVPDPLPAKEDLRAYAYEGEGSSAGSLASALSGLREEPLDDANIRVLVPGFLEVMDLLKHLPEATRSPSLMVRPDSEEDRGNSKAQEPSGTPQRTLGEDAKMSRTALSMSSLSQPAGKTSRRTSTARGEDEETTAC